MKNYHHRFKRKKCRKRNFAAFANNAREIAKPGASGSVLLCPNLAQIESAMVSLGSQTSDASGGVTALLMVST